MVGSGPHQGGFDGTPGRTLDAFKLDAMFDRLETLDAKLDRVAETLAKYGLGVDAAPTENGAGELGTEGLGTEGLEAPEDAAPRPEGEAAAKRQRLAQFMTAMSSFCTRQEALASRVEARVGDLEDVVVALLSEGLMNRQKLARFMEAFDGTAEGLLERMEGATPEPSDLTQAAEPRTEA
jgi:hypothetical protein